MLLDLENITFAYPGQDPMLKAISFSLKADGVYALMGTNGSGKTTLFNLIAGFLHPQSGKINLGGRNITALPPFQIAKAGVRRTFQDLRVITRLTVKENILLAMDDHPTESWTRALLPARLFRREYRKLDERAEAILQSCFLEKIRDSPAGEISYGQQKLLNFACSIATAAPLLLLDEPLAGVSEEYRYLLQDKIRSLKRTGKTVLFIDHHTDFIREVADAVLFLREGQIQFFTSPGEMLLNQTVMETYL